MRGWRSMYDFIKKTSAQLVFENFKVVKADVFKFIENTTEQYDFIFAGPPYALGTIDELPKKIFSLKLLIAKIHRGPFAKNFKNFKTSFI